MSRLKYAAITASVLALLGGVHVEAQQMDPSKTTYGDRNPQSPRELDAFAFLVGKWQGTSKTRLENGTFAEYPVSWIGRYVLDGTAIADEGYGVKPDGGSYLAGVTLRQYDSGRKTWVIEFVNVLNSFIRKQVNGDAGSVFVDGRSVTVMSGSPGMSIREHYLVADHDNFVYRLDTSTDGGRTWNEGHMVMTFRRLE
jgi:hypothetical protein